MTHYSEKALVPQAKVPVVIVESSIPQDASQLLDWLLWTSAQILAIDHDPSAVITMFNDHERRHELYTLTLQRLEILEGVVASAAMQLLYEVRESNLYQLDGWAGVTGWALSHRNNLVTNGGAWWAMGQIVDYLLPWMAKYMPEWEHRKFFEIKFLNRVIVLLPILARIISADNDEGKVASIEEVTALLEDAATAPSKQDLIDRHTQSRFDKLLAWSVPGIDGSVQIVIQAPDEENADRVLRRLKALIDYQGIQEIEA